MKIAMGLVLLLLLPVSGKDQVYIGQNEFSVSYGVLSVQEAFQTFNFEGGKLLLR